jgi:hypothetical protein
VDTVHLLRTLPEFLLDTAHSAMHRIIAGPAVWLVLRTLLCVMLEGGMCSVNGLKQLLVATLAKDTVNTCNL